MHLQEELRLFYNDLNAEQTHDFFGKFVELWNSGRLAQKYYVGAVAAPARRTAHQWNFKGASGGLAHDKGGMAAFLEDQKIKKIEDRASEKIEQRRWKAEQKEQLNELLPKATGREGRIEERIGRREDAKAREASPDTVRLPGGGDIYGGDDSIAAARAREASRQSAQRNRQLLKQEDVSHRAAAAQAKEDEKMAAFRALVQQGPIQIRKRE
ncbi:hypothetical protein DUNSADRAFT_15872 [Dunaliella salina]|uniref:Uncharacterized protein n=1 Tax=Dunaliella salina TaxID=3046 RepID=A0ABQ7G4Q8_DUNSA|nr:hypothetical protein DUNSADRAFT_15872 [Dunaliella salina]|eukprot:KAF5829590.1 hypothetical protein DUNSADRAFT_15872 [Dunaliella salina]